MYAPFSNSQPAYQANITRNTVNFLFTEKTEAINVAFPSGLGSSGPFSLAPFSEQAAARFERRPLRSSSLPLSCCHTPFGVPKEQALKTSQAVDLKPQLWFHLAPSNHSLWDLFHPSLTWDKLSPRSWRRAWGSPADCPRCGNLHLSHKECSPQGRTENSHSGGGEDEDGECFTVFVIQPHTTLVPSAWPQSLGSLVYPSCYQWTTLSQFVLKWFLLLCDPQATRTARYPVVGQ